MSEPAGTPAADSGPNRSAVESLSDADKARRLDGVRWALDPRGNHPSEFDRASVAWFNATDTQHPAFLTNNHYLAPQFIKTMLSLQDAGSYEVVFSAIQSLQPEFDSYLVPPVEQTPMLEDGGTTKHPLKGAMSDDDDGHEPQNKRLRGENDNPPPPPIQFYAWDDPIAPWDPSTSIAAGVDALLEEFENAIHGPDGMLHPDAVQQGYLPRNAIWVPEAGPETWTPKQCDRFASMHIPRVPLQEPARPDLLLYHLGSLSELDPDVTDRLELLHESPNECILSNASGSGKTRLLLELSCLHWTLFFMLSWVLGTNPYGSRDCKDALEMLIDPRRVASNGQSFETLLAEQPKEPSQETVTGWFRRWNTNTEIADHVYRLVLLARLLIYQRFRSLLEGHPEQGAMRAWCLLQICPAYSGMGDVFCALLRTLAPLSSTSAQTEIQRILVELRRADQIPYALIFDEAQEAAQRLSHAFGATVDDADIGTLAATRRDGANFAGLCRPLLKPLVNSFRKQFENYLDLCRTFVSGTKLHRDLVQEALTSSVGKSIALDDYVEFGAQDSPDRIESVLVHFLGPPVVKRISPVMREELNYWLQGRHRFVMIFVFGVLMSGRHPKKIMNVLSNILKQLTGHPLVGYDHIDLPYIKVDTIIPRLLRDPGYVNGAIQILLADSIIEFMVKGAQLRWADDKQELVSLGLARFTVVSTKTAKKVIINEHLVLVTLFHWVLGDDKYSPLRYALDRAMANSQPSPGGLAFEDVMALLFWDWFGDEGRRLDSVLKFQSPSPPWAAQNARLISVFAANSASGVTQLVNKRHTSEISYSASSADDTMNWFSGHYGLEPGTTAQCRCPILKPDNNYGADLALGLKLQNGLELMLLAQCKLWNTEHGTAEVERELWKLSPEGFYKGNVNAKLKPTFDAVMERFLAEKDFAPKPPPGKTTIPNEVRYRAYPPKYRVLRVFVAFSDKYDVDAGVFGTQAIGCYPFALLSDDAMEMGGSRFSSFRRAVQRAEVAEQAAIAKRKQEAIAEAAKIQAQFEEDARRNLRRSVRKKRNAQPESSEA